MISPAYDFELCSLKDDQEALEQQIKNLHKQIAYDLDLTVVKALKLDKETVWTCLQNYKETRAKNKEKVAHPIYSPGD